MSKVLFSIFKDYMRSERCIWRDSFIRPDITLFNRFAFGFPWSNNTVASKQYFLSRNIFWLEYREML